MIIPMAPPDLASSEPFEHLTKIVGLSKPHPVLLGLRDWMIDRSLC